MQTLVDSSEYSFEMAEEVRLKIKQVDSLHTLIPEDTVQDLKHVSVTNQSYCWVKRLMDILISFVGLTFLAIPFALIALVIYIDDPGRILFSQYRIGRYGKRFKLYKFRTMKTDTPKYLPTSGVSNPEMYITRVGHFLRKYSLDELPQLINVVKGDMSLVGPRPLIADEYEIHAMRMRFGVYDVRPGVTGLAQIRGRDLVSPAEKVHWDVAYLQRFGMWEDIQILFATLPKIFGGEGVVEGNRKGEGIKE